MKNFILGYVKDIKMVKRTKSPKKRSPKKKSPKKQMKAEKITIPSPIFGSKTPKAGKTKYTVLDWINDRAKILRKHVKGLSQQEAVKYASSEHNKWENSF